MNFVNKFKCDCKRDCVFSTFIHDPSRVEKSSAAFAQQMVTPWILKPFCCSRGSICFCVARWKYQVVHSFSKSLGRRGCFGRGDMPSQAFCADEFSILSSGKQISSCQTVLLVLAKEVLVARFGPNFWWIGTLSFWFWSWIQSVFDPSKKCLKKRPRFPKKWSIWGICDVQSQGVRWCGHSGHLRRGLIKHNLVVLHVLP